MVRSTAGERATRAASAFWSTWSTDRQPAITAVTPGRAITQPRATAEAETPTGLWDLYEFDRLRRFENWSDRGIAYAVPDMRDTNFWGVINGDNGAGIIRVADNNVTRGLKLWTWGYDQTADIDQRDDPREDRHNQDDDDQLDEREASPGDAGVVRDLHWGEAPSGEPLADLIGAPRSDP